MNKQEQTKNQTPKPKPPSKPKSFINEGTEPKK